MMYLSRQSLEAGTVVKGAVRITQVKNTEERKQEEVVTETFRRYN